MIIALSLINISIIGYSIFLLKKGESSKPELIIVGLLAIFFKILATLIFKNENIFGVIFEIASTVLGLILIGKAVYLHFAGPKDIKNEEKVKEKEPGKTAVLLKSLFVFIFSISIYLLSSTVFSNLLNPSASNDGKNRNINVTNDTVTESSNRAQQANEVVGDVVWKSITTKSFPDGASSTFNLPCDQGRQVQEMALSDKGTMSHGCDYNGNTFQLIESHDGPISLKYMSEDGSLGKEVAYKESVVDGKVQEFGIYNGAQAEGLKSNRIVKVIDQKYMLILAFENTANVPDMNSYVFNHFFNDFNFGVVSQNKEPEIRKSDRDEVCHKLLPNSFYAPVDNSCVCPVDYHVFKGACMPLNQETI